jgi:hypothetical protein
MNFLKFNLEIGKWMNSFGLATGARPRVTGPTQRHKPAWLSGAIWHTPELVNTCGAGTMAWPLAASGARQRGWAPEWQGLPARQGGRWRSSPEWKVIDEMVEAVSCSDIAQRRRHFGGRWQSAASPEALGGRERWDTDRLNKKYSGGWSSPMRGRRGASMRFSVKGTIPATDGRDKWCRGMEGKARMWVSRQREE